MAETPNDLAARIAHLEDMMRQVINLLQRGGGGGSVSGGQKITDQVTPNEWQDLARKLDQLEQVLTPKEKALLLAILGAAAASFEQGGARESPAVSSPNTIAVRGPLDR